MPRGGTASGEVSLMIRNDGRWQMSPRLARESDGLMFLFQVYLTASPRMADSGSNSEPREEQLRRRQSIVGTRLEGVIP
jgi:hypothetical protein